MDLHGLFRFCLVIVLSRTEPGVASRRRRQPRPVYKEWPETLTCEDRASNVGGLVMATIRPDGRCLRVARAEQRGSTFGARVRDLSLLPAFSPLLDPAGPVEVLAHRIIWTLVLMAGGLTVVRGWLSWRAS